MPSMTGHSKRVLVENFTLSKEKTYSKIYHTAKKRSLWSSIRYPPWPVQGESSIRTPFALQTSYEVFKLDTEVSSTKIIRVICKFSN